MTPDLQNTSMDIDSPGGSNAVPENGLNLYSVSAADSGEGLPYAPEDFPNPGDKWGWKVGRRLAASGHFLDRYVYLPKSLSESGNRKGFASRLAFEQYIRDKFPDTDINTFFASFSWRIPSAACKKDYRETPTSLKEGAEDLDDKLHCKAGNRFCSSLAGGEDSVSRVMFCDICCSEPGFCRDCCCILCCRTIDKASSDSYITCEANFEGSICGHSCHLECGLRAYMAGTVGGSIGLDAEYYCRRCDSITDLVPHFKKLLEDSGESIVLRDGIEKVLRIGVCALRGSKKTSAKQLLKRIELAVPKLENGNCFEDIWKKDDISAGSAGLSTNADVASGFQEPQDPPKKISSYFDHRVESLKLEDEIDRVLDSLKKSQEIEYRLAEERLSAQKNYILNLYQKLDKERSKLSKADRKHKDSMLDNVLDRVDQIKGEVSKLKDMEEVAKGFGRVDKHVLKEQFGVDFEH